MSDEKKISLVRAAAKLKRAKRNQSTQSDGGDGIEKRNVRRENSDGGLIDGVIGLVHRLKRD